MIYRIHRAIDRVAAILDLCAAVIFIALLLKVYSWMSIMFGKGLIK
ncbi:hypothetical protein [Desulforamulus reducens]|nr:hypothetical protein [Desulforamulus reducens]